jgi:hypothetical protein
LSEIAICGNAVVITVASICCMMIADATIMATTFGFVAGDIVRGGTCAGTTEPLAQSRSGWVGGRGI